jgi:uncharacterized repeat protein (TIGR01451 family)
MGALPTITITVIPQAAAAPGISNKATISGNSADTNTTNDTATLATTVIPSADVAVSLTAPSSVLVGANLVYTLKVTNNGLSPATGVQVVDTLPANVTFVSATGGVVPDASNKLTFAVGSLAAGSSVTYDIVVTPQVPAGGTRLSSSATITGAGQYDPDVSNNTATATTAANPAIDLAVSQLSASPNPVVAGSGLAVTYVVTNNGPSPATNVRVVSPLLSTSVYVSGSGIATPSGTVSAQGSSVVATLGTLAAGASVTVSFAITPGAVGTLTTAASASGTEQDTNSGNNAASVTTTVLDRLGTIEFAAAAYSVNEDAGTATITVSRVQGSRGTVQVDYQTASVNATPGLDFTPVSGTLTFADGETSKTIVVPVLANPYDKVNEVVNLVLSNVRSAATPGQALLGSPATTTLTIVDIDPDTRPLVVSAFQWTGTVSDISQVFVTFNKPLIQSTAVTANNYLLQSMGADGKYGTGDESQIPVTATYDPSSFTVTLTPSTALPANNFFHLILTGASGGLEDLGGNELSGDGTNAGTPYTAMFARGTKLSYYTPTNSLVTLTLGRGGVLDDLLQGNGQGERLTLVNRVARRSVLSGTVRTPDGKAGQAYLGETIWGLGRFGDVRVRLHAPQFLLNYYPFSPGSKAFQMGTKGPVTVTYSTATAAATPAAKIRTAARPLHAMTRPFHAFHH